MKIVINAHSGCFGLSDEAFNLLGIVPPKWGDDISNEDLGIVSDNEWAYRSDPRLVEAVETLADASEGWCAGLSVVTIPDDVNWTITEDHETGIETIREVHRYWS